jgi:hypothetical protein
LKTKILVIASAAIIGIGGVLHAGHEPKCLMRLMAKEKPAVTTQASFDSVVNQGHDPKDKKKKHHGRKNHGAKGHEPKCHTKKASI